MTLPETLAAIESTIPRIRASVARSLLKDGWTQAEVARALHVSQAMVSRYAAQKRVACDLATERLAADVRMELVERSGRVNTQEWTLRLAEACAGDERAAILEELLRAARILTSLSLRSVVPAIGVNIARCIEDAGDARGVASFPGRLVDVNGRLVAPAPPEFGSSGHLARCLMTLRARENSVRSLGSIRGGDDVARAAQLAGLSPVPMDRRAPRRSDPEAAFARAVGEARSPIAAIHDPGAVGIEPCLYVAGPDGETVARRILAIDRQLVKR